MNNYSQNINYPISILYNKHSEVIDPIIHHKYRIISSYNITTISDTSYFSTFYNTRADINQNIHQRCSIVFGIEKKSHRSITSNAMRLIVAIDDLIFF